MTHPSDGATCLSANPQRAPSGMSIGREPAFLVSPLDTIGRDRAADSMSPHEYLAVAGVSKEVAQRPTGWICEITQGPPANAQTLKRIRSGIEETKNVRRQAHVSEFETQKRL